MMMENVAKDWKGNSVAYSTTNGFANNREGNRQENDLYCTDPVAVELLMELEQWSRAIPIWECANGLGHLSNKLDELNYAVIRTDKYDYGIPNCNLLDFLLFKSSNPIPMNILTNPPYKYANEFIEKGMEILAEGYKLALFLPIRYLEGKARKHLFTKYPPKTIYVSSSRIKCAINGNFDETKSSAVCYCWMLWEKGWNGETILKWFN